MQEIKCPNCGKVFQVEESGYAAIVKQIRDREFAKELSERLSAIEQNKESELKLAVSDAEKSAAQKKAMSRSTIRIFSDIKEARMALRRLMIMKLEL